MQTVPGCATSPRHPAVGVPADGYEGITHVVCFEEAGECTLERIAREARKGDGVLAFGPEHWALRLKALGLGEGVPVISIGRRGATYPRTQTHMLTAASRAYGPRAAALAGVGVVDVPLELPPAPRWPDGRRARIRRELGIAPHERAVLVICEPGEWADLGFAMRAIAMARVAGSPLRPVVSPRAPRRMVIEASLAGATPASPPGASRIIADDRCDRPWELLPALDLAICDQDGLRTHPPACAGWRAPWRGEVPSPAPVSPLPAWWALACGVPALIHASIELGPHAGHPLVTRFDGDVAQLARELHARASSASAASR
jgi:hypothetical protein